MLHHLPHKTRAAYLILICSSPSPSPIHTHHHTASQMNNMVQTGYFFVCKGNQNICKCSPEVFLLHLTALFKIWMIHKMQILAYYTLLFVSNL